MKTLFSLEHARSESRAAWGDVLVRRGIKIMFCVLLVSATSVVLMAPRVPPEIPIHFSRPWGDMQLAPSSAIWWLFATEILIGIVHITTTLFVFRHHDATARILLWSGVFVITLLSISIGTVFLRVGSF